MSNQRGIRTGRSVSLSVGGAFAQKHVIPALATEVCIVCGPEEFLQSKTCMRVQEWHRRRREVWRRAVRGCAMLCFQSRDLQVQLLLFRDVALCCFHQSVAWHTLEVLHGMASRS